MLCECLQVVRVQLRLINLHEYALQQTPLVSQIVLSSRKGSESNILLWLWGSCILITKPLLSPAFFTYYFGQIWRAPLWWFSRWRSLPFWHPCRSCRMSLSWSIWVPTSIQSMIHILSFGVSVFQCKFFLKESMKHLQKCSFEFFSLKLRCQSFFPNS